MEQAFGYVALGAVIVIYGALALGFGLAHWRAALASEAHRQGH